MGSFQSVAVSVNGLFPLSRRVRGSLCLSNELLFTRVAMAKWRYTDPERLRLSDVAEEAIPWPHHKDHPSQNEGRKRLRRTLLHLGDVLAAIWNVAFRDVFDPFCDLLDACPTATDDYTVIYLASRVEHALAAFAEEAFGPARPCLVLPVKERSPDRWAAKLRALVAHAAEVSTWEAAPTWRFFAFDGEFSRFFVSHKKAAPAPLPQLSPKDRPSPQDSSGVPGDTVTPKKRKITSVCHKAIAAHFGVKDSAGQLYGCDRNPCKFSHEVADFKKLTKQELEQLAAGMLPPLSDLFLAVVARKKT